MPGRAARCSFQLALHRTAVAATLAGDIEAVPEPVRRLSTGYIRYTLWVSACHAHTMRPIEFAYQRPERCAGLDLGPKAGGGTRWCVAAS